MSRSTAVVLALLATAVVRAQTPGSDAIQRALLDPHADRATVYAAASTLMRLAPADRAPFLAVLRATAAAAPGAEEGDPRSAPSPAAFSDEIRTLMGTVVTGDETARAEAIARLGEHEDAGAAALAHLRDRANAVLQRGVLSFLRTKIATNALYAGQYSDLQDCCPEVAALMLAWSKQPPKETTQPGPFRAACVRALRDLAQKEQVTDAMRRDLRAILQQAEQAGDSSLFVTVVCALHQFGDPAPFDAMRAKVAAAAETEDVQAKTAATNTLAELHYQLRDYEHAAEHFRATLALLEQAGQPPGSMVTVSYNAACALSLAGKIDDAFALLEKALGYGAKSRQLSKAMLDEDHDTDNLRKDPRFAKLLEQHFGALTGR